MRRLFIIPAVITSLAVGLVLGMSIQAATSSPGDINIHNIQKSFNPVACEVTITWDTDECTTTNIVHWDTASCAQGPSYPYSASGGGAGRSHSATFDVSSAAQKKISFTIESANACDTQTTACMTAISGPCASQGP